MRVAVVGCGSIGRRHIGNLLALGCEVVASDVDATVVQRDDWPADAEFVKSGPLDRADAVVIATPWDRHLAVVEECIRRRLPFLVEKPLGSLEQLPRWRAIAAMDHLPINQVGYQCRFHPRAQALKALFPAPSGGMFVCAVDMRQWPGRHYGPFILEASHELDLMLWLGAPDTEITIAGMFVGLGQWALAMDARAVDYYRAWQVCESGDKTHGGRVEFESPEALGTEMYRAELEHFLACVKAGTPTLCPLADGLRVLEVCAQVEALAKQPA